MKVVGNYFIVMVLLMLVSGCEKNQLGVCEMRWGSSSYSYYCVVKDAESCTSGWEYYFESKSCSDLGYTEKHTGSGGPQFNTAFVSPDGKDVPGENGYFAGGGGAGGGSVNCDLANYDGPEFDIQVDSQCKTAYLYDCAGDITARNAACDLYYEYGNDVWTGSGSLPKCPYCN